MRRSLILFIALLVGLPCVAAAQHPLRGRVLDASGRAVSGARVALRDGSVEKASAMTDRAGQFTFEDAPVGATILVAAAGFENASITVGESSDLQVVIQPSAVAEEITVTAPVVPVRSSTATKTDTPLRDVPQSVTVISREVMEEQGMQNMTDVVRYVPGISTAQGEGNRDTPIFRGNASTADFFIDGVRDDVQYYRDVYNLERVEALKGPNAMIFGRGGAGGVLNRVTRQAEWDSNREVMLQGGSWNNKRATIDLGQGFSDTFAARVTGVVEETDTYRDGVGLNRHGFNPTVAFVLGPKTVLRASYEFFHDERNADRGISSFGGKPVATDASTFFGNADLSQSEANVHIGSATLDHRFSDHMTLRSRVLYGNYDKFYQNVFPGAVDAAGANVSISAYNNDTQRKNLFSQNDLVIKQQTGRFAHTILAGIEIGRQTTDNFRATGYFTSIGANVTSVSVPLTSPTTSLPIAFRQSATDADNHGVADIAAIYVQDQIALSSQFHVLAGVRYDNFSVDFRNNRTGANFDSEDHLVSPRLGLVYKPIEPVSLYASYSLSYLPRAGEQLSSLSLTNQALDPEEFRNYEVGAKWDVSKKIEFAASVYRLDRSNVAVPDPVNPAVSMLVDGQRVEGLELSAAGNITDAWSILGAYAFQDGEILESLSATARAGARLAQLPKHSASLWNKLDLTTAWGVGLGIIHRGEIFTSTDNTVTLPGFTRVDAAVFYTFNQRLRAQLNVENLLDTDYYLFANSNTNITPGSPRGARLSITTRF